MKLSFKNLLFLATSLLFMTSGCKKHVKEAPEEEVQTENWGETMARYERLAWMLGTWNQFDSAGRTNTYENWNSLDGVFSGFNYALVDGDTVPKEDMSIVKWSEGEIRFLADLPSQNEPIPFVLVPDTSRFVARFVNPQHDFPKYIEYRRSNDTLYAKIGDENHSTEFNFVQHLNQ